jgi:hypothetical protein
MRTADLFDCFERHLMNLNIECETEDLFIAQVLENYFLNLVSEGVTFGAMAEDIYSELYNEVLSMLNKKIYGHYNLDSYRDYLRKVNNLVG